jgi:antitoxin ChpS
MSIIMKTSIRKIGNSAGAILPAPLLKKLRLRLGDDISIREEGMRIVIEPAKTRRKYKLQDLVAQCSPNAPLANDLHAWENAPLAGEEMI